MMGSWEFITFLCSVSFFLLITNFVVVYVVDVFTLFIRLLLTCRFLCVITNSCSDQVVASSFLLSFASRFLNILLFEQLIITQTILFRSGCSYCLKFFHCSLY